MKRFGDTRRLPEQLISHDHPEEHEHTRKRNWLARNLLRSLPGRVVMSAYSTSVTKATLVNCLSPWGDDDFVILPNVRVRDLFILAVTSSMNIPGSDFITDFIYETLVEEILETEIARIQRMIEGRRPEEDHFQRFLDVGMAIHTDIVTTAVKTLTLRLRYDHLMKDAALGLFCIDLPQSTKSGASSDNISSEPNLQSPEASKTSTSRQVALPRLLGTDDSISHGWMSPYLFSSHRWPALPRESDAAVIFCHGPFLPEDYAIAQKLLEKSSLVISLCSVHRDEHRVLVSPPLPQSPDRTAIKKSKSSLNLPFQRTVLRRIRSAQDKLKEMNDTVQDKLKEANEKARELPNQTRRRMESAYQSSSVTSRIASAFKSQSLGPQYISPSPHHSPKLDLTPPSTKFFDPDTYAPYNETKPATGADSPFHSPSLRPQYDSPNTQSSPTFEYPHVHQPHRVQTMPPPYSQAHNTEPGTTTNHLAAPHPPLPHRMNTSPGQLEHTEVGLAAERRMVILLLGIKPHRGSVWASSERPEESVLRYQLFNGCPAIVLPMRSGGPLLGWHTMTLQGLHDAWYRDGGGFGSTSARQRTTEIDRITQTLFMFVDQCINWERVNPDEETEFRLYEEEDEEAIWVNKRLAVARALELLVVAAAQSDSMELRRNVDRARTGIAFFRLP